MLSAADESNVLSPLQLRKAETHSLRKQHFLEHPY